MKRASVVSLTAASLVLVLSLAACAPVYYSDRPARTYMGFSVGIESAPPPPPIVFRSEPSFFLVAGTGVRVVNAPDPDCDMFQYGGYYYLYNAGYWYRSRSYDGDYVAIEVTRVPRPILQVPERHWRHHPGRGHGHGRGRWNDRDRDRDDH